MSERSKLYCREEKSVGYIITENLRTLVDLNTPEREHLERSLAAALARDELREARAPRRAARRARLGEAGDGRAAPRRLHHARPARKAHTEPHRQLDLSPLCDEGRARRVCTEPRGTGERVTDAAFQP